MLSPVIDVHNVSVSIGGRPILRRVDLAVPAGQFVAVMGANGSGKSTLIRAITRLWPLAAGDIRLWDTPIEDFSEWQRVGYVPQRASAVSGVPASVWEVVASGRLARRRRFRPLGRADREVIERALETVGLQGRRRDGVSTLSGGQQQRVLIARALAGEPELLLLDEPTAGVDLPNQIALAETLARLGEAGTTIVLVTHEMGPLSGLIERSVVMRDGRVAYDGTPLSDADVHRPDLHDHPAAVALGDAHSHHHEPEEHETPADHLPHVRGIEHTPRESR